MRMSAGKTGRIPLALFGAFGVAYSLFNMWTIMTDHAQWEVGSDLPDYFGIITSDEFIMTAVLFMVSFISFSYGWRGR